MLQYAKPLLTAIVVFILVVLYSRFGPGLPVNVVSTQKTDLFSVSGEGKVTAIPDTAKVMVGATIERPNLKAAQEEANNAINRITAELVKIGIPKEDIKTVNYSINPTYDYTSSPPRSTGFTITINQEIVIKKLELTSQVIDTATSLGGNLVGGLEFTVNPQKKKELETEARKLAIEDAKEKAGQMADAAGISLGKVINIQETPSEFPRPVPLRAIPEGGEGGETQVQPGTSEIVSNITLTFETR